MCQPYFHTRPVVVTQGQPLDVEAIIAALDQLVDGFTCRGSGYVLDLIKKLTAVFLPFLPLGGSSSVQTPPWLYGPHAVINVKNYQSQDCFRWAIVSAVFPVWNDRFSPLEFSPGENILVKCLPGKLYNVKKSPRETLYRYKFSGGGK